MTVDVDGTVANALYIIEGGWRPLRTLLARAGDRLVLQDVVWTRDEAGGASEVEMLALDGMDAEGRFLWTAGLDPDDRAAADAELFERYAVACELTGELHVRPLCTAAIAPHGRVVMIRAAGTNTEGGAFESYCAALVLYRDERIASFEFFEPEDLDAALARLAECHPARGQGDE